MPPAFVRHGLEHADGVGGDSGGLGGVGGGDGEDDGGGDGGGGEGADTITSPLLTGSDSSTPLSNGEVVTAEFTAVKLATDSAICTVVVSPSTLTLTSASVRLRVLREFRALRILLI